MIFEKIISKKSNLIFLSIGMLSMSQAGVLIKLSNASVYSIAFYRVFIASLILMSFYPKDICNSFRLYKAKDYFLFLSAGLMLSLHFLTWNYCFTTISVSEATLVISTSPIFVAIGAYIFFKEKPNLNFYPAFILSFIGLIFVTYNGFIIQSDTVYLGLVSVLISTIFFALYVLVGKKARIKTNTQSYLFNLYFSSAIFSFIFYVFFDETYVHTGRNYFFFILLAIFPTIIGHGSVNHTIKFFKASMVSMNQLVQPLFASIVAYFVLAEEIYYASIFGYIFILLGMFTLIKGMKYK